MVENPSYHGSAGSPRLVETGRAARLIAAEENMNRPGDFNRPVSPLWNPIKNLARADADYDRLTREPAPRACTSCGVLTPLGDLHTTRNGSFCQPCVAKITAARAGRQ